MKKKLQKYWISINSLQDPLQKRKRNIFLPFRKSGRTHSSSISADYCTDIQGNHLNRLVDIRCLNQELRMLTNACKNCNSSEWIWLSGADMWGSLDIEGWSRGLPREQVWSAGEQSGVGSPWLTEWEGTKTEGEWNSFRHSTSPPPPNHLIPGKCAHGSKSKHWLGPGHNCGHVTISVQRED